MREHSFGEDRALTPVDRFGVWLSARAIHGAVPTFRGLRIGDFGCGYDATFVRSVLPRVAGAVLVDVSLAPDLQADPKVRAIEGVLPDALDVVDDASLDVVMCTSVLEHLWEPEVALREFHRVLAPAGVCIVNVPSWLGKRFLELSAFTLGTSGPEEIADHKRYFDPKDLWPLLVRAGFSPERIRCHRHKFGLNTFAVCRLPGSR
jgi:SAM-dependent methyltransferase